MTDVGGASRPTKLEICSGPISNDPVEISFLQSIGANDALWAGSYSNTLTFTLSTTTRRRTGRPHNSWCGRAPRR